MALDIEKSVVPLLIVPTSLEPFTKAAPQGYKEYSSSPPAPQLPGTRPSPLDGRLTTSTGTPTLDNLLAGHAGLAGGNSLLIEETGTTDFAGSLLRYYAAEGVVQGHIVHVVGVGQQWGRTLPGLIGAGEGEDKGSKKGEKMKIAWRYERLGEFRTVAGSRGGLRRILTLLSCKYVFCRMRLYYSMSELMTL